jgi:hypothetical protein
LPELKREAREMATTTYAALRVRQGATLPLTVEVDDETAVSVAITVKETADDLTPVIYNIANFDVNGVADLTIGSDDTGVPEGDYIYQLTVVFSDGTIEKYPDPALCGDNCTFPDFIVCESLDPGVS